MKRLLPAIVLFFLSPMIGEVLLGSAPPVEFFSIFGLTVLTVLYGGGAILIRELTLGWGKGWVSLLILGAAYGIIEEGLMVKSFFDPNWRDIGILGSYGRLAGINWVWSLQLTIYHAVISIAIPIQLTEMIFKDRRDEAWVGRKGFAILAVLFVVDVVFGYFALTAFRPGAIQYLLTLALVVCLFLLAWKLPRQVFAAKDIVTAKPFRFWLLGFLGTFTFFFVYWVLPNTGVHPLIAIVAGVIHVAAVTWLVLRMSGNGGAWTELHRLGLVAGPMSLFIIVAPFQEFAATRSDNTAGMTMVGIGAAIFLLWLRRRVKGGVELQA